MAGMSVAAQNQRSADQPSRTPSTRCQPLSRDLRSKATKPATESRSAPRVRQTKGTAEPRTHNRIEREEESQPRRDTTTEEADQRTEDKGEREKEDIENLQEKKDAEPQRHGSPRTN